MLQMFTPTTLAPLIANWYMSFNENVNEINQVREAADMSSLETRRLLPGDTCVQAGETIRVDPGVVRMPIEPDGWVTVHARAIGGPTFLELAPEDEVESEPDYGDVPGTSETKWKCIKNVTNYHDKEHVYINLSTRKQSVKGLLMMNFNCSCWSSKILLKQCGANEIPVFVTRS